ncbi:EF-hand domain-containing protein [Entamoeba marina]
MEKQYNDIFTEKFVDGVVLGSPRTAQKKTRIVADLNFEEYDSECRAELDAYQIRQYIINNIHLYPCLEQVKSVMSQMVFSKNGKVGKAEFSAFKQSLISSRNEYVPQEERLLPVDTFDKLETNQQKSTITENSKSYTQDLTVDNFWSSDNYHSTILSFLFKNTHTYITPKFRFTNVLGQNYYSSSRFDQLVKLGTLTTKNTCDSDSLDQLKKSSIHLRSVEHLAELYFPDINVSPFLKKVAPFYYLPIDPKQYQKKTFICTFTGTSLQSTHFSEDLFYSIAFYDSNNFQKVSSDYSSATSYRAETYDFGSIAINTFAVQLDPFKEYCVVLKVYRNYSPDLTTIREWYYKGINERKECKTKSKTPRIDAKQFIMSGAHFLEKEVLSLSTSTCYGLKFYKDEGLSISDLLRDVDSGKAKESAGSWGIKIQALTDYKSDSLVIKRNNVMQFLEEQPFESKEKKRATIPLLSDFTSSPLVYTDYKMNLLRKTTLQLKYYWRTHDQDISTSDSVEQLSVFVNNLIVNSSSQSAIVGKNSDFTDEVLISIPFPLTPQHHLLIIIDELNPETIEVQRSYYTYFEVFTNNIITSSGERVLPIYKENLSSNYFSHKETYDIQKYFLKLNVNLNSSVYPSQSSIHQFLSEKDIPLNITNSQDIVHFLPLIIQRFLNAAAEKSYTSFLKLFQLLDTIFDSDPRPKALVDAVTHYPYFLGVEDVPEKQVFALLFRVLLNATGDSTNQSIPFLRYSWVLFELAFKSIISYTSKNPNIVQELLESTEYKQVRKNLIVAIAKYSTLIRTLVLSDTISTVVNGNTSLAIFLGQMISVWSKGDVCRMLETHLDILSKSLDSQNLHQLPLNHPQLKYLSMLRVDFCLHLLHVPGFYDSCAPQKLTITSVGSLEDYFYSQHFPMALILRHLLLSLHRGKEESQMALSLLSLIITELDLRPINGKISKDTYATLFFPVLLHMLDEWDKIKRWRVTSVYATDDLDDIKTLYYVFHQILRILTPVALVDWLKNEVPTRLGVFIEHLRRSLLLFTYFPFTSYQNPTKTYLIALNRIVSIMQQQIQEKNKPSTSPPSSPSLLGYLKEQGKELQSPRTPRTPRTPRKNSDLKSLPKSLKLSMQTISKTKRTDSPIESKKVIKQYKQKESGIIERGRVFVTEIADVSMQIVDILLGCCVWNSTQWEMKLRKLLTDTFFELPKISYFLTMLTSFYINIMENYRSQIFGGRSQFMSDLMHSFVVLSNTENNEIRSCGCQLIYAFTKNDFKENTNLTKSTNVFLKALCELHLNSTTSDKFNVSIFDLLLVDDTELINKSIVSSVDDYLSNPSIKSQRILQQFDRGKSAAALIDILQTEDNILSSTLTVLDILSLTQHENNKLYAEKIQSLIKCRGNFTTTYFNFNVVHTSQNSINNKRSLVEKQINELKQLTSIDTPTESTLEDTQQIRTIFTWIIKHLNVGDISTVSGVSQEINTINNYKIEIEHMRELVQTVRNEFSGEVSYIIELFWETQKERIEKLKIIQRCIDDLKSNNEHLKNTFHKWAYELENRFSSIGNRITNVPSSPQFLECFIKELDSLGRIAGKCLKRAVENDNTLIEQRMLEYWEFVLDGTINIVDCIITVIQNGESVKQSIDKQLIIQQKINEYRWEVVWAYLVFYLIESWKNVKYPLFVVNCEEFVKEINEAKTDIRDKWGTIVNLHKFVKKQSEEFKRKSGVSKLNELFDYIKLAYKKDYSLDTLLENCNKEEEYEKIRKGYAELWHSIIISNQQDNNDNIWDIFTKLRSIEKQQIPMLTRYVNDDSYIAHSIKIDSKKVKSLLNKRKVYARGASMVINEIDYSLLKNSTNPYIDNNGIFKESSVYELSFISHKNYSNCLARFKKESEVMLEKLCNKYNDFDTDGIAEKYYAFSQEYYTNPQLHLTWMKLLAEHHKKHCNNLELGLCKIHIILYLIPLLEVDLDVQPLLELHQCPPPPSKSDIHETMKDVLMYLDESIHHFSRSYIPYYTIIICKFVVQYYERVKLYKKVPFYHRRISDVYNVINENSSDQFYYVVYVHVGNTTHRYIYISERQISDFKQQMKQFFTQIYSSNLTPHLEYVKVSEVNRDDDNHSQFTYIKRSRKHVVVTTFYTDAPLPNVLRRSIIFYFFIKESNDKLNECDKLLSEVKDYFKHLIHLKLTIPAVLIKTLTNFQSLVKQIVLESTYNSIFDEELIQRVNMKYVSINSTIRSFSK